MSVELDLILKPIPLLDQSVNNLFGRKTMSCKCGNPDCDGTVCKCNDCSCDKTKSFEQILAEKQRPVSIEDLDRLSTNNKGELFWDGKKIV